MTTLGEKILKAHESASVPRLHPYDDKTGRDLKPGDRVEGKITIGWGRNLSDVGISASTAAAMLNEDIATAERDLISLVPSAAAFPPARWDALVNMAYNLGRPKLVLFERLLAALRREDWHSAADEMLDSQWARQVGKRASDLAFMVRTAKYPPHHIDRYREVS